METIVFSDDTVEDIMESVKVEVKSYNYYPGYVGSYFEPPEPEELEMELLLTTDIQLTKYQIAGIQNIKKKQEFFNYCELYVQQVLKERLYNDKLDYWEIPISKDDLSIVYKDNLLSIEIYVAA